MLVRQSLCSLPGSTTAPWVKAAWERVAAAVLLTIAIPLLALVVLAIRLDSPGSAVFWQRRVGKDGREFTMLKLRTMCCEAERMKSLADANEGAPAACCSRCAPTPHHPCRQVSAQVLRRRACWACRSCAARWAPCSGAVARTEAPDLPRRLSLGVVAGVLWATGSLVALDASAPVSRAAASIGTAANCTITTTEAERHSGRLRLRHGRTVRRTHPAGRFRDGAVSARFVVPRDAPGRLTLAVGARGYRATITRDPGNGTLLAIRRASRAISSRHLGLRLRPGARVAVALRLSGRTLRAKAWTRRPSAAAVAAADEPLEGGPREWTCRRQRPTRRRSGGRPV